MKNRLTFLLMAGALLAPGALSAQRSLVEEANRLYAEGRYAEAHEMYLEALRENPGSPLIRFNEGNALYRNQEFERAFEAYQDALEAGDTALAQGAWYNLGNSLFRQQQLDASLEAYKQALRIDPGDTDAKHNLERVLEQMEEQENQQEQQNQNQDGQDQENQDQQQPPPQGDPEQDEQDQDQPPPGDDEQEQDQPAQPPPGQMTPEEAERLLQAIQEDPDEVDRPPRADSLGAETAQELAVRGVRVLGEFLVFAGGCAPNEAQRTGMHRRAVRRWAILLAAVVPPGLALAAGPTDAAAQEVSARAYLSSGQVGVGQQFVVNLEVSGAQQVDRDPELPDLTAFSVYLGSGSSSSIQMSGGRTSITLTIQYRFQATRAGTFTIDPIGVQIGGGAFTTAPLTLTVSDTPVPQGPSAGPGVPGPRHRARGPVRGGGAEPVAGVREPAGGGRLPHLHAREREFVQHHPVASRDRLLGGGVSAGA